jgi:hypothetical protein
MSYVQSNYYQNPGPVYYGSDKDEPVPGWGPAPNMAGPLLVGVGRVEIKPTGGRVVVTADDDTAPAGAISWWWWVLGSAAVGAAAGVARNAGHLKFLRRFDR